jgi:uncharacterized membrane protein
MNGNPRSTASIAGHPIHPMLIPFPIAFFVSAFATDLAFTAGWAGAGAAKASVCLLGAGLIMAALAALAGVTDFLGERRIRSIRTAWLHMIGNVTAVVLELINLLLRYPGRTDTVPSAGLFLSLVVVLLLLFNGWMGWELVYKHRVGVSDRPDV